MTCAFHDVPADAIRIRAGRLPEMAASSRHQGVERLIAMGHWLAWAFRGLARWWRRHPDDRALHALAALGGDEVGKLSQAGRQLRRKILQEMRIVEANR
jgi:hypothetical protein